MNLTTQKRLAADLLKVGVNRVWIDPNNLEEVSRAITREGVNKLIQDGYIKARPKKGISSYRSKKDSTTEEKKEEEKVEEVSKELKGQETLRKQPG